MKLKIGFIGFGKSANRYHLPFINQEKYEVVGYYKPSQRQFEMPYPYVENLKQYASITELLAADIDLVIVSSPAKYHLDHAKAVVQAKKHVLIEKPVCNTGKQYQELIDLAAENKVKVQVYQNRRFDSDFVTFKKVLLEEKIGKPIEIESNHTQYRLDNINLSGTKYDGFAYGHAVHFVDQIVSVFGNPDQIISDIANQRNYYFGEGKKYQEAGTIDDYYDLKLIYDNMRVRIRFSQIIYKNPPRFIINGTKGCYESYEIDQAEAFLKRGIFPTDQEFNPQLPEAKIYYQASEEDVSPISSSYAEYYEKLYDYIVNDAEIVVPHQDVITTLAILEKMVSEKN